MDWGIVEDVEVKKYYYQKIAVTHRKWRTDLTKVWREGGTSDFAKLQIEEKDREEFVDYRMTQEFDVCLFLWTTYLISNQEFNFFL